jgi:hypothetical protein
VVDVLVEEVVEVLVELVVLDDVELELEELVELVVLVVVVVDENPPMMASRQPWTSAWIVGLCPHAPDARSDAWSPLSHFGWQRASRPGTRTSFAAHMSSHPPALPSALTDVAWQRPLPGTSAPSVATHESTSASTADVVPGHTPLASALTNDAANFASALARQFGSTGTLLARALASQVSLALIFRPAALCFAVRHLAVGETANAEPPPSVKSAIIANAAAKPLVMWSTSFDRYSAIPPPTAARQRTFGQRSNGNSARLADLPGSILR